MTARLRPTVSTASLLAWCALLACAAGLAAAIRPARASDQLRVPERRVDLAAADADEIALLPGVGPALAARIVAFRAAHRLDSLEDLAQVEGLGDASLESIRAESSIGRPARR